MQVLDTWTFLKRRYFSKTLRHYNRNKLSFRLAVDVEGLKMSCVADTWKKIPPPQTRPLLHGASTQNSIKTDKRAVIIL
jgi:hypothetical protein